MVENLSWEKARAPRFLGSWFYPKAQGAIPLRYRVRLSACRSKSGGGPSDLGSLLIP